MIATNSKVMTTVGSLFIIISAPIIILSNNNALYRSIGVVLVMIGALLVAKARRDR